MAMNGNNNVASQGHQAIFIKKGMEPVLYHAALSGSFEKVHCNPNWKERVTPTGNNVLHIHLGKPLYKRKPFENPRNPNNLINMDFIRSVLDDISGYELLWKQNEKGDTPLHLAARFGHANAVEEFLERVKNVNPQDVMRILRMNNKNNDTVLHEAARAGPSDVVKLLVEADDPNTSHQPNKMYETPLYLAAETGSTASVVIILETCNASALLLHQYRPCGRTPLHAAVQWGDREMVRKMLQHDGKLISVQDDEGWTPIHCAAAEISNVNPLKELLAYDEYNRNNNDESSCVYLQDNNGRTALHVAVLRGNWMALEIIMNYCPDCAEITDKRGQTVLHYTAKSTCIKRITNLLKLRHLKNIVNEKDEDGNTALHIFAASILNDSCHFCLKGAALREFIRSHPYINFKAFNNKNLTFSDIIIASNNQFASQINKMGFKPSRGKRIYIFTKDDLDVEKAMSTLGEKEEVGLNFIKKIGEVRLIVASLIATVSFTSALTLPGGFNQSPGKDIGKSVLKGNAAFRAFLVSDIIAFIFSILAIIIYFGLPVVRATWKAVELSTLSLLFMLISMGALGLALTTGVSAVVSNSVGLVIVVWIISAIFFVIYIPLLISNIVMMLRRLAYCSQKKHEIPKRHRKSETNDANFTYEGYVN